MPTERAEEELTSAGSTLGTVAYMSPEQARGEPIDARTDVFSLGIVLYQMVTGAAPFQGNTSAVVFNEILSKAPASPVQLNPDVPTQLADVIAKALEKDREMRYQSARDLLTDLKRIQRDVSASEPVSSAAAHTFDSHPSVAVAPNGTGKKPWVWGLAGAAAIVVLGSVFFLGRGGRDAASSTSRPATAAAASETTEPPSVAVLPFADLSPEKDQEYFTDGMTEELLFALDGIEGLKVPSRTAIFALKGKDLTIEQVGERLGVSTVLEGSVRKAGERLRITAQLVQVNDGFRLWTETYDRTIEDVFAVQDEIAQSIASALELTLATADTGVELAGTADPKAYDFLLRGRDYRSAGSAEANEFAIQMYENAVETDPGYALAWAELATAYLSRYINYSGGDDSSLEAAGSAAQRALDLQPDLSQAHVASGSFLGASNDFVGSDQAYAKAIELDPSNWYALWSYGNSVFRRGELELTAELWERAYELDPERPGPINLLMQVYKSLGLEEKVRDTARRRVAETERHLELNPDDFVSTLQGATALLTLGERNRAFSWADRVLNSNSQDTLVLYNTACFYALAGDSEKALIALEKSVEFGDRDADWWRQDSDLDNVRDHPKFAELLARMEALADE
jgi:TolB-like protein